HVERRVVPRAEDDRRAIEADGVRCAAHRCRRYLECDRRSSEIADFQFEARIEIVEQLFESEGETVAVPAIAVLAVAPLVIASVSIASVAAAARGKRHGLGARGANGLH